MSLGKATNTQTILVQVEQVDEFLATHLVEKDWAGTGWPRGDTPYRFLGGWGVDPSAQPPRH
jgi:hypothetical protein